jgi:hypothetical protein
MMAQGVVPLMGLDTALGAIAAAQRITRRDGWEPWPAQAPRPAGLMSEAEGKDLLRAAGIPVPNGVAAATLPELVTLARHLPPPLVLKGLGFAHKTEAGAVRLNLATLAGQSEMPGAQGYLAEVMLPGAVAEVLVGLRRDPIYGLALTLGMGGVLAELLAQTATLVLPAAPDQIARALQGLPLFPLLNGYRGRPRADLDALVAMIHSLTLLMQRDDSLEEIELNPVLVFERGVAAVDALIRKVD